MLLQKLHLDSPIGHLALRATDRGLSSLLLEASSSKADFETFASAVSNSKFHPVLRQAALQLLEYFSNQRRSFTLPLDLQGTEFQKKAWSELLKIPFGNTISYGDQALRLGDGKKARAVGSANGRNPVLIFVPCHRVVARGGELGGFRAGLEAKRFLLELEGGA